MTTTPLVELVVLIVTSPAALTGRIAIGKAVTIIISDKTSANSFLAVLVLFFMLKKSSFFCPGVPANRPSIILYSNIQYHFTKSVGYLQLSILMKFVSINC